MFCLHWPFKWTLLCKNAHCALGCQVEVTKAIIDRRAGKARKRHSKSIPTTLKPGENEDDHPQSRSARARVSLQRGSHSGSRPRTNRRTGPRPVDPQLPGDRHGIGIRPRSGRLGAALHLQPGDWFDGLSDAIESDDGGRPAGAVRGEGHSSAYGNESDAREALPMQRISSSRSVPDRSDGPLRRKRRSSASCPGRTLAPVGIATLAPAFAQGLPTLGTVPTAYSHEFRAELLYDLCAALVREGLGEPETCWKCDRSGVLFT